MKLLKPKLLENFDPQKKKHRDMAINFVKNNAWENTCPFELEWPYHDVPTMIKDKLLRYYIK